MMLTPLTDLFPIGYEVTAAVLTPTRTCVEVNRVTITHDETAHTVVVKAPHLPNPIEYVTRASQSPEDVLSAAVRTFCG